MDRHRLTNPSPLIGSFPGHWMMCSSCVASAGTTRPGLLLLPGWQQVLLIGSRFFWFAAGSSGRQQVLLVSVGIGRETPKSPNCQECIR